MARVSPRREGRLFCDLDGLFRDVAHRRSLSRDRRTPCPDRRGNLCPVLAYRTYRVLAPGTVVSRRHSISKVSR
jgi:hypothetical protein